MTKEERHRPFSYENVDSNTMVIFVHGVIEGPNQFKEFAKIAYKKNFSYSAILLDGHGKRGIDFAKSNKEKWIESLDREIVKYKDKYEKIILVGHSMGGLLSILASLKYKDKVSGLVLIAVPFRVFIKFKMIISIIKIYFGRIKKNDFLTMKAYDALSVGMGNLGTYIKWIPRYLDLFTLMHITEKKLPKLEVPTLIIYTKKDELVSEKSLRVLEKNLRNDYEIIHLEESGHFYYNRKELSKILKKFKEFLDKV